MQSTTAKSALIFDVDGTLTHPRMPIECSIKNCLMNAREKYIIGLVSGSDLVKISEQVGPNIVNEFDYIFPENGLITYHNGKLIHSKQIKEYFGDSELQRFANYVLKYIANLELPFKRGTFFELRSGLINISPIGRNCSKEERDIFEAYDKVHQIRKNMIQSMTEEFSHLDIVYSIGGQISFDVFPRGWDKTYCLNILQHDGVKDIHFFGDKVYKGGNDYEIYNDKRVKGNAVEGPSHTLSLLKEMNVV
ncbi:hypothetical protein GJ496_012006 [Pomphorhynchus laevis]|nr:hypothetical protein GJ496_012006 [Pomphorhynchus laevis]